VASVDNVRLAIDPGEGSVNDTAIQYESEARACLATAEQNNVGTQQAAYWLARAQVYATLAVAATAECDSRPM
jgi:hypothetical protein